MPDTLTPDTSTPPAPPPGSEPSATPAPTPTTDISPTPAPAPRAPTPPVPAPVPPVHHSINPLKFFFWLVIIFFFLFALLIGVMIAGLSSSNGIIQSVGLDPVSFKNWTISLVNFFFGAIAMVAVLTIVIQSIGLIFASKEETAKRKRNKITIGIVFFVMVLVMGLWYVINSYVSSFLVQEAAHAPDIFAYAQDDQNKQPIDTLNITTPSILGFSATWVENYLQSKGATIQSLSWDKENDGVSDGVGDDVKLAFDNGGKNNAGYNVALTVRYTVPGDTTTKVDTYFKQVTVAKQEIYGDIVTNADTGEAPLSVNFDASSITHPYGAPITSYSWDMNNDGIPDFAQKDMKRVSWTFDQPGSQTVSLTVTATYQGLPETKVFTKTILIRPSSAVTTADATFSANPTTGTAPLPVVLDASASGQNTTVAITNYEWLIDDGVQKLYGKTNNYIFQKAGTHTVQLKVTYASGDIRTDSLQIKVADPLYAPKAVITAVPALGTNGAISGPSPFHVTFDGSSSKDQKNSIVSYAWDFGDGTTGTGSTAAHVYRTLGTYTVQLTVTNADSLTDTTQTKVIVNDELPVISFGASTNVGTVPFTVNFDASGSKFGTKKIVSYEWVFSGPTTQNSRNQPQQYQFVNERAQASRDFTDAGQYTIQLTLVADDGTRSSDTMLIIANPPGLQAVSSASRLSGSAPLAVSFASDKSLGNIARREWIFNDDGTTSSDTNPVHIFQKPGTYDVVLKVYDAAGTVNSATKTITVK